MPISLASLKQIEADHPHRPSDLELLRRLARVGRPYWGHLVGVVLLSCLAVPLTLLSPLPLKIVVDHVFGSQRLPAWLAVLPRGLTHSDFGLLWVAIAILIITTLLLYLQGLASSWLQTYTSEQLVLSFRTRLFHHVKRLSL